MEPAGYVVEPARGDHRALLDAGDARWAAAPAIAWGAAPHAIGDAAAQRASSAASSPR